MNSFFCSQCGHAAGQAKEMEAAIFCPQCGGRMEREDFRQENAQEQISASRPLTIEAASSPQEVKRCSIQLNDSALISQSAGRQNMLFKPGDRVRYDGQSMDKSGLKAGMEGEVVSCFQSSVDVYFTDLRRVVHLMDFHMRTSLRRVPHKTAVAKEEKRGETRRIIKLCGLIASVILIMAVIIVIIKFQYPEILQEKYFLRYFKMR